MVRTARPLLVLLLVLALVGIGVAGTPPARKTWIEVEKPTPGQVEWILDHHLDVAGENPRTGAVGLVVTDEELELLAEAGFTWTVRGTNTSTEATRGLDQYTDPVEMEAFVDQLVADHPDIAKKITLKEPSEMWEGHRQYLVKITKDVDEPNDRPTFIFDAQHHAREVMTPEIARDMLEYLVTRYGSDPRVTEWVDNINIYIVPIENPDGAMYVFTHDSYWRRNRRPNCAVDPNRNYPFIWNACNGSSGSCSSDTNRGPSPASEPETQGMLAANDMARALFALSYHTYGEYIMYSYGCFDPDEMDAMDAIARELNSMLENDQGQTGQYRVGPVWSTIYEADGGSLDTQYGKYGTYAYVIEANSSGFQPDYDTWRDVTVERQRVAWQFFLDKTLHGPQVRGKVTDARTGEPLPAEVSVQEISLTHGEEPRRADDRGIYHWLVRPGQTYHFTWSMPGYCSETREVTATDGPVELDVELSYPLSPDDLAAEAAGDNAIRLTWSLPQGDIDEFRVYRSLHEGGPWTQVGTAPGTATEYLDDTVSGGVTYWYVVRSFRNCEGHDSNEASAETTGACREAPEFGGVSSVSNPQDETCTLEVAWDAAHAWCGGRITYRVWRSTSLPVEPTDANLVAAGITGTSWRDHDALASGTRYHYLVRATDSISGAEDANEVYASSAPTGPDELGTWADDAGDNGEAKLEAEDPWKVDATGGHAGPAVYATGNYGNDTCAALTTPVIRLDANPVLSFHAKYDIETNYDAGRVEVAEGPSFDDWQYLDTVNYPDGLAYSGNECGFPTSSGNTVFSHENADPQYTTDPWTGSLAAYSGKEVKLRFRISSDGGVTKAGWWVDDITVSNAWVPSECDPGVPPNPQEASPAGDPLTVARAEDGGTGLVVDYLPACGAIDHAIYWGHSPIQGALAWTDVACHLGATGRATFDPGNPAPGEMLYFVVVGQADDVEGSYGKDHREGSDHERPEATGLGDCDLPQQLGGSCP